MLLKSRRGCLGLGQVAWHLVLETRDAQPWLQFERPSLVWARSMHFKAGQVLRVV